MTKPELTWQQRCKTAVLRMKYFTLSLSHEELQAYCQGFELYEIHFIRLRESCSQEELDIIESLVDTDDYKPCKACLVGMAFPSTDGYNLQGNEHSIMILSDKDANQEILLQCTIDKDNLVVFVVHEFTGDLNDYLTNSFDGFIDQEDRAYSDELFFREFKGKPKQIH